MLQFNQVLKSDYLKQKKKNQIVFGSNIVESLKKIKTKP